MSALKAIETRYNGYLFRSRLEARWAVFFDTLGLEYRYESEGFNLDGLYYLPDFFLPTVSQGGCWLEIKPVEPKGEEAEKTFRFRKALLEPYVPFYVLVGEPYAERDEFAYDGLVPWPEKRTYHGNHHWFQCPLCGRFDINYIWVGTDDIGCDKDMVNCEACDIWDRCAFNCRPFVPGAYFHKGLACGPSSSAGFSPVLRKAYAAARSARFEHGQQPHLGGG
jgi:hypothetical protein